MPRSFSQDGAAGAGSSDDPMGLEGQQTGGTSMSDPGQISNPNAPISDFGGSAPAPAQGGSGRRVAPALQTTPFADGTDVTALGLAARQQQNNASSFSQGGAIPEDDSEDGNGTPEQDSIQKALQSVDQVLSFGRKLHGLGGGDDEGGAINTAAAMPMIPGNQSETPGPYKPGGPGGQKNAAAMPMIPGNQSETPGPYVPQQGGGQKLAANMPMVPGTQSESGRPPVQPQPGPLPPTNNPFGKRADADSDGDGAIDTDEDAA